MIDQLPFRLLDRSGRNLTWIKIDIAEAHKSRPVFESPDRRICLCPRPAKGQPPDIITHPCHSEDGMFFRLKDEVHEWFVGANILYQFEFRYVHDQGFGWYVGVRDDDQVMMIKLAWA